ncbi:MAG: tRNA uridine-5-carboxymethylaminomethyl(34) synthesis GTPase MnmE [Coprobacillus sp.]|nr:tRNA uridine-5-carboxymethylaminomethyl(34) synthesis GTPase MnmE [Coprobacillus sp.]
MFETIVALSTAPIKSALAIIRVSGDDCFDIVNKCFSKDISGIKERSAIIGKIMDNEEVIDEVVLILYRNPKSYTGEDMIEIICHGSMVITDQILAVLLKNGARMATNGEYTSRAFLNQKMDLVQAEAVNDVINATSVEAKNLSLLSLEGETSKLINPIKEQIADLLSLIEVNIDFPEYEDIEEANSEKVVETCSNLINQIDVLIKDGKQGQLVKDGINVAIVGKPNVGKSTLLNALLGENKAIVSDEKGTTRDIVEGDVNLNGLTLHLLDTAGLRDTENKVETLGVEKTKEAISKSDLVIVILNANEDLDEEDKKILDLVENKVKLVVYNKADLVSNFKEKNKDLLYISALNGDIDDLKDAILKLFNIDESVYKTASLNNTRQLGLLANMRENLTNAADDARNGVSMDLVSIHLYSAYQNVLDILGEDNKVDISKEIFSRFCVGK